MPVLIKVSQNKNDKTAAFGKWYGRVVSTKTMSYQELCKHMSLPRRCQQAAELYARTAPGG